MLLRVKICCVHKIKSLLFKETQLFILLRSVFKKTHLSIETCSAHMYGVNYDHLTFVHNM